MRMLSKQRQNRRLDLHTPAILALADGTIFHGKSIGADGLTSGEIVFNTAMTGYQEILTDPSYAQQIVTLTYPHIGNTGVVLMLVERNRKDEKEHAKSIPTNTLRSLRVPLCPLR